MKVAALQNPAEVRRLAERYLIGMAGSQMEPNNSPLALFGFNV